MPSRLTGRDGARHSRQRRSLSEGDDSDKALRWSAVLTMFLFHRRVVYLLLGMCVGVVLSLGLGIGPHWIGHGGPAAAAAAGMRSARHLLPRWQANSDGGVSDNVGGRGSGSAGGRGGTAAVLDAQCPIPGGFVPYEPPSAIRNHFGSRPRDVRVAFASHPRSGSTWSRILIERLSQMPTAIERESWANVLAHRREEHGPLLENGIVIKTHSLCTGCYPKDLDDAASFMHTANPELCLNPSPGSFAARMHCAQAEDTRRARRKGVGGGRGHAVPCCGTETLPYHRAIVLVRHPLDVIKSNFHFRLTSLHMDSKFDYGFVTDRAEAWAQLYDSWLFSEFLPHMGAENVLLVYYERLKEDTPRELRRIRDFLHLDKATVTDARVQCAADMSTTDVLHTLSDEELLIPAQISKGTAHFNEAFFGGRDATTSKLKLEYSEEMWLYFREGSRVQELAEKLGYDLADVNAMPRAIMQD